MSSCLLFALQLISMKSLKIPKG